MFEHVSASTDTGRPILRMLLLIVAAAFIGSTTIPAEAVSSDGPRIVYSSLTKKDIVDTILTAVADNYVLPDVAREMVDSVRSKYSRGDYAKIDDLAVLLNQISLDMQDVSRDEHLRFEILEAGDTVAQGDDAPSESEIAQWTSENFGFNRIEMMKGNVGYLDLRTFRDTVYAKKTLRASMDFLANCQAVIIDLRNNRGGRPEMLQMLAGYFLATPGHLYDIQHRGGDSTTEHWSFKCETDHPLHDVELVILIGKRTFSAAESFAYSLKRLGRATLVGEATAGGAHLVRLIGYPTMELRLRMPVDRAVDPATGYSWQSIGVQPDIAAAAANALALGHIAALEAVKRRAGDMAAAGKLNWLIDGLRAELDSISLTEDELRLFVGHYQQYGVELDDGQLLVLVGGKPFCNLKSFSLKLFAVEEHPESRVRFVIDEKTHTPTALEVLLDDGRVMRFERTGD
ncbi:MAG: S41 family peptidase [candidate division Zixibacteria bacterium]|nr:S41 family peptidase [candidate division Zixibacteria bacterium]